MNSTTQPALVRLSLAAASLLALSHGANAAVTSQWEVQDYEGFDLGEPEDAIISSLGQVRPGWTHAHTKLDFDSAWSSVVASDGTIYIGSDNKATIYQAKGNTVRKLASVGNAVAVVSLAIGNKNTLYAGTMPDGEIWRIDTKSGKSTKLATLADTETIWSLAYTPKGLFAGTGPNGLLYSVNPTNGKAKQVFDSEDKRIMSLLATGNNAVWLGTSDKALVFRHDLKTGQTRAMADFSGNEVSALAEWKGMVIAAANDLAPGNSSGFKTKEAVDKADKKREPGQTAQMPEDGTSPGADPKTPEEVEPQAKSLRKGKGALFRIRGDGQLTQLHALSNSYFTSIAVNDKHQIFAGAADKGRVYLIEPDNNNSVSTAIDVDQRYIAQVLVGPKNTLAFTTGDSAGLYRSRGQAPKATYLSEVFDAQNPARFGQLQWHSRGKVSVETRSGNTAEPELGWSRWQSPSAINSGVGGVHRGKVVSPPGRYLQYRVRFGGDKDAVLSKTSLYYLPANRPTLIQKVTITPTDNTTLITRPGQAIKVRSPILKIAWEVANSDDDKTSYQLAVRREGESIWRAIYVGDKPLTAEEYKWNTQTYPDGHYRVRVRSSDQIANSPGRALQDSYISSMVIVDNERPTVQGLTIRYPTASAQSSDALSTIAATAFSIDDGPWYLGASRDGIFDQDREFLIYELPKNVTSGIHTLAIRVVDSAGNIATTSASFSVK